MKIKGAIIIEVKFRGVRKLVTLIQIIPLTTKVDLSSKPPFAPKELFLDLDFYISKLFKDKITH